MKVEIEKDKMKKRENGLKEFFKPTLKKIGLGIIILIIFSYLFLFKILISSPSHITPSIILLAILSVPIILLLFINNMRGSNINFLIFFILQIFYIYFLACSFFWLKDKYKKSTLIKKRIASIIIIILIILIIVILLSPYLKQFIIKTPIPDNLDNVIITLNRDACFGTCPVYSLVIYGNGTVFYKGDRYVNLTGNKIYYIPKGDVQLLVDEFIEINYFALEDEYLGSITDFPSTTTSITINNKTKNIYDYISGPKKLKDLERKIDEVGLSKQWVNG